MSGLLASTRSTMQSPPILLILTLVVGSGLAGCVQTTTTDGRAVQSGQIKNLVTFGDSYTDPTFSGYSWETYVAGYGPFNLYCASIRFVYGRVPITVLYSVCKIRCNMFQQPYLPSLSSNHGVPTPHLHKRHAERDNSCVCYPPK